MAETQPLSESEQAYLEDVLARRFKKARGKEVRRQISARLGKLIEGYAGTPTDELNRRFNLPGPDKKYIAALHKQLTDLAQSAEELKTDRQLGIGELAKKKGDILANMSNIITAVIRAEGSRTGTQGAARMRAQAALLQKQFDADQAEYDAQLNVDGNAMNKISEKAGANITAIEQGARNKQLSLQDHMRTGQGWSTLSQSLKTYATPGQKIKYVEAAAGSMGLAGGADGLKQLAGSSNRAEANAFIKLVEDAERDKLRVQTEKQSAQTVRMKKALKELYGAKPNYAREITKVLDAVNGWDGTKKTLQDLDNAIAALTPAKEGEPQPYDDESTRILNLIAEEGDTRGPIEQARQQLWATGEFQTWATDYHQKDWEKMRRDEKMGATKALLRKRRKSRGDARETNRESRRREREEEKTGQGVDKISLPDEPETNEEQSPSAAIAQPPSTTDQVPEEEAAVEYEAIPGLWNKKRVEYRAYPDKVEIYQDGKLIKSVGIDSPEIESTIEIMDFWDKEGLTDLAGKEVPFEDVEDYLSEDDLPEDALAPEAFDEEKFAKEAKAVPDTAPLAAPLTPSGPILADIEKIEGDISPRADWEVDLERKVMASLMNKEMAAHRKQAHEGAEEAMQETLAEEGWGPAEREQLKAQPARVAELLRKRLQIEAGVGRE